MNQTVDVFVSNLPIGAIIMYHGTSIPENWAICDGENGTPNLIGRFIQGGDKTNLGTTGGAAKTKLTLKHLPAHSHTVQTNVLDMGNSYDRDDSGRHPAYWDTAAPAVTSSVTGETNPVGVDIIPPFYTLIFIMKTN